jgi:hypothetical protein
MIAVFMVDYGDITGSGQPQVYILWSHENEYSLARCNI